jgi:hypothetical protein
MRRISDRDRAEMAQKKDGAEEQRTNEATEELDGRDGGEW